SGDLVDRARRRGARACERALVPAPPRPEAAPSAETRAAIDGLGERPLLVTVARLAPQKGLDLLCATAGLLTALPEARRPVWVVAGDGPLEGDLRRWVAEGDLPVRVLGRREDVPDLLAAADLVVSTARWEGQPLWVQEALALGAAVVATDVGGTREVTGEAARLLPAEPAVLAAAMLDLLADERARTELQGRARARALELPDLRATLGQLDRLYRGEGSPRGSS
ncbi:glycosyltransferase, partial [Actinotalea sp. C106]|uniref:glycosyltransferase n=1 Tax=Actinotalea sp. C106 TaxID=2908644 RepID=UPI002028A9AE